jgi:hypothetical protein
VNEVVGGQNIRVFVATGRYLQLKPLAITVFLIKNYIVLADYSIEKCLFESRIHYSQLILEHRCSLVGDYDFNQCQCLSRIRFC